MSAADTLYRTLMFAVRPLVLAASPLSAKLGRAAAGWRWAPAILEEWAAGARDPARPLVWVHAPSVGEGLMAQAIVGALRRRCPDAQVAFTHFSASAERIADRIGADVHAYLPWDVPANARRVLDALRPSAIAFVRTEIWPTLVSEAASRRVPALLVNAVLAAGSGRLRPASRWLLSPAFARLRAVGAVAQSDAARFPRLGVPPERVHVTGDARFDQVWTRLGGSVDDPAASPPTGPGENRALVERLADPDVLTVVAGSTWTSDHTRLVPAILLAKAEAPVRFIIAPHEPDDRHLRLLDRALDAAGIRHARLAAIEAVDAALPDVVVVDRLGVLADLYAAGEVAYVGGGFHAAGLHSVVEPAALARPVLFGPRHGNAREATGLAAAGGGFQVEDATGMADRLVALWRDAAARLAAGRAAVDYVAARLGAADRNAALIERALTR